MKSLDEAHRNAMQQENERWQMEIEQQRRKDAALSLAGKFTSIDEAKFIFIKNINKYQELCKNADNKILSNAAAFFNNLIPWRKKRGGEIEYQLSERFLKDFQNANLTNTEDLIEFAINYPDQGNLLAKYIWKSIREATGYTKECMQYLISDYKIKHTQTVYEVAVCRAESTGWQTYGPSLGESKIAVENAINHDICKKVAFLKCEVSHGL